jgi:hypothetical protein
MSKPSEVAAMVRAAILMREPFFLKGAVGVGKSQVVKQVCDELGIGFTDVRLSQMDPTDIKGFPCPDQATGQMRWLPANFFPPMGTKAKPNKTKGLLFMDEMNSAVQAVQASAYQLTLDFKVGDYVLPEGWTVGAAGNRAVDRSIVNKTPAALNNRLIHIEWENDLEDWVAHARTKGIADINIAWLRFRSALFHSFDPAINPEAFPTPRGWFKVDKIMKQGLPANVQLDLIRGTVGNGAAMEHLAYLKTYLTLPTVQEIAVAPDTTEVPEQPSSLYALTTSLASATTKTSFSNFLQYVSRMEKEWQVRYIRDVMKTCNEVKHTKPFVDWSMTNADVLL